MSLTELTEQVMKINTELTVKELEVQVTQRHTDDQTFTPWVLLPTGLA